MSAEFNLLDNFKWIRRQVDSKQVGMRLSNENPLELMSSMIMTQCFVGILGHVSCTFEMHETLLRAHSSTSYHHLAISIPSPWTEPFEREEQKSPRQVMREKYFMRLRSENNSSGETLASSETIPGRFICGCGFFLLLGRREFPRIDRSVIEFNYDQQSRRSRGLIATMKLCGVSISRLLRQLHPHPFGWFDVNQITKATTKKSEVMNRKCDSDLDYSIGMRLLFCSANAFDHKVKTRSGSDPVYDILQIKSLKADTKVIKVYVTRLKWKFCSGCRCDIEKKLEARLNNALKDRHVDSNPSNRAHFIEHADSAPVASA